LRYRVRRGRVEVTARSSIHDTTTVWTKLAGTIDMDPDQPATARAEITLDMRVFDAGDRSKNWKLRGDLNPDAYPTATFQLARVERISEVTGGRFEATAAGKLAWRDRATDVRVQGKATVDRRAIEATAGFELDVHQQLGVTPPRLFVFKVEDVVRVQVAIFATAEG
jgi:polyisoprenoid-binding protein YceI